MASRRSLAEPSRDHRDLVLIHTREFLTSHSDQRLARHGLRHFRRKGRTINRQRMASRHGTIARHLQQQRSRAPHFFLRLPQSSEAMIYVRMVQLMVRRLRPTKRKRSQRFRYAA